MAKRSCELTSDAGPDTTMIHYGDSRNGGRLQDGEPVLLAEADESYILKLSRCFERASVQSPLVTARDRQQTLEYLTQLNTHSGRRLCPIPCLILLSTELDQQRGLHVLEWMHQEESPIHLLPVILLGPPPKRNVLARAMELGAYDYVLKSMNDDEMMEWVQALKSSPLECGPLYSALISYLLH